MSQSGERLWMANEWAQRLGPAIAAMAGVESSATVDPATGSLPTSGDILFWRQPFDRPTGAEVTVAVPSEIWAKAGGMVLEAAGLEEADDAERRSTFLEVLQQSLAPLGMALGGRLGGEVSSLAGEALEEPPRDAVWTEVTVTAAHAVLGRAWISSNVALLDGLKPKTVTDVAAVAGSPIGKPSKTLDLLMEVELPVGVSFGRAQMRLKDAIKLTTGSIVELNRSVSEPVEIIVNNCVIARGEVVVVEGNYGVRIKQIVSREERLRTLF